MPNGIGVIDADYYNNESNEGEIFVQLINFSVTDVVIKKGQRIAQGIFMPYLLADQDGLTKKATRIGGFGSSDK
ncbi:deoxyuridine 5'-triphosphate nucleotidohydrolase [Lentilactobacillus kosonis]|uniref:Deoxyuridine 5'-triphosphate nucleotidohydrolase n=1 Tax=Lentilactobacillus kosonis TaxID=2810561 RepID=A0A401FJU6_9LACO|nr:deoxyuridine 5'-triphosphate nucleotidohydrolase [Lentilactobacillus kosonis]